MRLAAVQRATPHCSARRATPPLRLHCSSPTPAIHGLPHPAQPAPNTLLPFPHMVALLGGNMKSPVTRAWRLGSPCAGHHACVCKALGSGHGALLVEQHRSERSVPSRGSRSPVGPSWVSRAEGQGSPASTGSWQALAR